MQKLTKKTFSICILCCMILGLASCFGSSSLIYWIDKKITVVDLINYDNPDAKNNPSEKYILDLEKIEVLETLDLNSAEFENFSADINIRIPVKMNRKQYLFSHNGKGLRIIYEDESFQVITLTEIDGNYYIFMGSYAKDGTVIANKDVYGVGPYETFMDIINKYFTTQI